jgi:hypothetical protein
MSETKVEVGQVWKYANDECEYTILRRHELDCGWRVGEGPGEHFSDSAFGAPGRYGMTLVSPASQHPARAAGQRYAAVYGSGAIWTLVSEVPAGQMYAGEWNVVDDDGGRGILGGAQWSVYRLLAPQEAAVSDCACDRTGQCVFHAATNPDPKTKPAPAKAPTPVSLDLWFNADGNQRGPFATEAARESAWAAWVEWNAAQSGGAVVLSKLPERIDRRLAHSMGVEDDTLEDVG